MDSIDTVSLSAVASALKQVRACVVSYMRGSHGVGAVTAGDGCEHWALLSFPQGIVGKVAGRLRNFDVSFITRAYCDFR
eukprot:6241339-Amphidinium_carterae.1